MRFWSIHPSYLDAKGLVAQWREGLLAQAVLMGKTRGYINHPQLLRFKNTRNPIASIAQYLRSVADEAQRRGYSFDRTKIGPKKTSIKIKVTEGQIEYEIKHLKSKLEIRDPQKLKEIDNNKKKNIQLHPLFVVTKGEIEVWEKITDTLK